MKKLCLAFCLAIPGLSAAVAHADSYTYTFTGSDELAGSNFTYVAANGFLAFDTGKLATTTATDLYFTATDRGPIKAFDFQNATSYYIYYGSLGASAHVYGAFTYNLDSIGIQTLAFGSLDIEPTFTPAAVAPEPSSLILLGTGALGILNTVRRRRP